jgi:hypothetical protein
MNKIYDEITLGGQKTLLIVQDLAKHCHCDPLTGGEAIPTGSTRPRFNKGLAMTFSIIISKRLHTLVIFICVSLLSSIIFYPNKVHAQSLSLSISPPILEVLIKPGKSITQTYKLSNSGDPVIITPKVMEIDENGIISNPQFSAENWITLINTDVSINQPFLLQTNTEKQIILKINPPQKSAENNYYRALVFSTSVNPIPNTSVTSFSQNLGTILLICVTNSGLLEKTAKISKFDLPKIIDSFGPLIFDISVINTGKIYFRPIGQITLNSSVGNASFRINPTIIFEGQTKTITEENTFLSRNSDKGFYVPGFYLGKYELEVKFNLDESKTEVSMRKTFYAIPWKVALIVIILFIIGRKIFSKPKIKHAKIK